MARFARALWIAAAFALAACGRLDTAGTGAGADWVSPGGDAGKTHYSRLAEITRDNVRRLGFAWEYQLDTTRGLEATPIVVDGVMYTSGVAGRVYALNAATGAELWTFTPEVDMQVNRTACCDMVNRGVAVSAGKVFVGALDGVLYALDAATGAVVWRADTRDQSGRGITSTGAPEVANGVVIIGNAGAEYDTRGYVSAFDVNTGRLRWRFYTVPRDPAFGAQDHPDLEAAVLTWDPHSRWDIGGGGTPWDAIVYDPEFDAVYVGTGNGNPSNRAVRSPAGGDNLYLSSIVALDPRTGRLKWHYQETPGESWDYTAVQPMVLTRIDIAGRSTPVILHAPKNGFLYVLDRRDGRLLAANPIVHTNWADRVDLETGRPHLTPERSDYSQGPQIVFPSLTGARNWHPISFNPQTGLLYGAVIDMGALYLGAQPQTQGYRARALNNGAAMIVGPELIAALPSLPQTVRAQIETLPELARVRAMPSIQELRAIDPLTGETRWAQPLLSWQDRSGVLTTAGGLVVAGSIDGRLKIFDAETGALLNSIETGSSIIAAPMTYQADGVQYIAVMAGWGGGGFDYVPASSAAYRYGNQGRILSFKLDGGAVRIPDELPALEVAPAAPPQVPGANAAMIAAGQSLFNQNCAICHSNRHRSLIPDLRRMDENIHPLFNEIVLEGLLVPNGMPRWDDVLSVEQAHSIHAYLIDAQRTLRREELALQRANRPLDGAARSIMRTQ